MRLHRSNVIEKNVPHTTDFIKFLFKYSRTKNQVDYVIPYNIASSRHCILPLALSREQAPRTPWLTLGCFRSKLRSRRQWNGYSLCESAKRVRALYCGSPWAWLWETRRSDRRGYAAYLDIPRETSPRVISLLASARDLFELRAHATRINGTLLLPRTRIWPSIRTFINDADLIIQYSDCLDMLRYMRNNLARNKFARRVFDAVSLIPIARSAVIFFALIFNAL